MVDITRIAYQRPSAAGAKPLTRNTLIELAERAASPGATELDIHVHGENDLAFGSHPLARIELRCVDGIWALQYVPHPSQCAGITGAVRPQLTDYIVYAEARRLRDIPPAQDIRTAKVCKRRGEVPPGFLNLRADAPTPCVPNRTDTQLFRAWRAWPFDEFKALFIGDVAEYDAIRQRKIDEANRALFAARAARSAAAEAA